MSQEDETTQPLPGPPKTGPQQQLPSKRFWESTWFKVGAFLMAPLIKNLFRSTFGQWLAKHFEVDIVTWDSQRIVDYLTIAVVAGVAGYAWLRTNVSRKVIAGVLIVLAIGLAFRAGASHWTTVTAVQWVASGLLALAALYLFGLRIWRGLSPEQPCVAPIKGTEGLGPVVAAMVEKKLAG